VPGPPAAASPRQESEAEEEARAAARAAWKVKIREAIGEGTLEERVDRLRALGPDAWAVLLEEPDLAEAADRFLVLLLADLPEPELRATASIWLEDGGRLLGLALPRLGDPPRAALADPLVRYLASGPEDGSLEEAAEGRLLAILGRDGLGPVESVLRGTSGGAAERAALARVLGRRLAPDAIGALMGLAGDLDLGVRRSAVAALGLAADGSDAQVGLLSALLSDPDIGIRKAAVVALGRLRSTAAVDLVIPLLEAGDPGLERDAHYALKEITGQTLPPEAEEWRAFWDEERVQAARDLPLLLLEIESGDPAATIRALREAASMVAGRERIRRAVLPLFGSPNPSVRAAACATLGSLRDVGAVEALIGALEDPDPGVWDAAWKALQSITGRSLPPRADLWRRAR